MFMSVAAAMAVVVMHYYLDMVIVDIINIAAAEVCRIVQFYAPVHAYNFVYVA